MTCFRNENTTKDQLVLREEDLWTENKWKAPQSQDLPVEEAKQLHTARRLPGGGYRETHLNKETETVRSTPAYGAQDKRSTMDRQAT